ncbi:MAG: methyltransferase [Kangiella sp.]|jgi:predicted nicotinamide N-methyase|nr:methyltransferase [Kangiella sp.]
MPELQELPESHTFQTYGIVLLENKHRLVKKLKRHYTPSIHGHKAWNSSFLLMDYFLHSQLLNKHQRVLELGCGWGPTSIFCAHHAGCHVTGTDRDEDVFPFLELQASMNQVEIKTRTISFEKITKNMLSEYSIVFGTDICFWDDLSRIHYNLINRAKQAGVKNLLLADPGRQPFFDLAEKALARHDGDLHQWYCNEPEYFDGFILHLNLQ